MKKTIRLNVDVKDNYSNNLPEGHTSSIRCECKPKATRDGNYVTIFHK